MTQAYPLHWPAGWPRAKYREKARFSEKGSDGYPRTLSMATAFERLEDELEAIGAKEMILSSNLERTLSGRPKGNQGEPVDQGVALYFLRKGKPIALACDRWNRVADNINAIAKHIEAIRGMERWGVGSVDQVFTGYERLPAPEHWTQVLGVSPNASAAEVNVAYRQRARSAHPDQGGSGDRMARLNAARDAAIRQIGGPDGV